MGLGLAEPEHGLYRRGTAAALVAGPLLFLVANLLHPQEFTRGHEREQLAEIAGSYTSWQLAHLFTFASVIVLVAAVLGLAYLVRRRGRPAAGLLAGALALAGLMGVAFVDALDGYTWGILGELSTRPDVDSRTLELALHDVQQADWSLPYYVTPLLWLVGMATLALLSARTRAVSLPAALVFALGIVLVGVEAAVQDNVYFIVAASILLAGGAALAVAIWGLSDEEFASGIPANHG